MLIDCPGCGEKMYLSTRFDESECFRCHHVVTDIIQYLPNKHLPEAHYQSLLELRRARQARQAGERQQEIRALKKAVQYEPRLIHPHIRLGRILSDKRERRRHLMIARRIDPDNMEVITLLARLQASLSPEEALKLFGDDAPVKEIDSLQPEVVELQCPVCRGSMRANPQEGHLECRFCGYSEIYDDEVQKRSVRERMAENVSSVHWEVGEYVYDCKNCGAQWTHSVQLSTECPYCNADYIVIRDKVDSFIQPQGLIPFELNREQARQAIDERLDRFSERLKGFFNPNAIKHAVLNAVYLPFWVFDEEIDIRLQTEFDVVGFKAADTRSNVFGIGNTFDLGIPAIKTVSSQMTQQLGYYLRGPMVTYEPGVLDYPAEIYEIDLDRAVLRARTLLSRAMSGEVSRRYKQLYYSDFSDTSYQLILAPVWLAQLHEVDGDLRPALINGQNGKVVLGKAHRPG